VPHASNFPLTPVDYVFFFSFLAILSLAGFLAGRRETHSSNEYFLAGNRLTWWVIGCSLTATVLSTDHLIGQAGWTVLYGISIGMWGWGCAVDITLLIFLWVPFLLASRAVTIPQFLQERFDGRVRVVFAVITLVMNIVVFMAGVLYSGGLAISELFGWDISFAIIVLAIVSGTWAIYGGLSSVAWTDTVSALVLVVGCASVVYLGLHTLAPDSLLKGVHLMLERNAAHAGVWASAVAHHKDLITGASTYNRLSVLQPSDHLAAPTLGLVLGSFSVGIWYNVMNQFVIQRILAARSTYDARMGLVFLGILYGFLVFLIVLPGMIIFALRPEILLQDWGAAQTTADRSYIDLIQSVMPVGLRGLFLAALFAAAQSTVNSVLNSTATVFAMDIYREHINRRGSDRDLVRVSIWASVISLSVAILIAILVTKLKVSIFYYMQMLSSFFAPPFSAVFILGVLWRRMNTPGAIVALTTGFIAAIGLKLAPYLINDFPRWATTMLNQAFLVFAVSTIAALVGSYLTPPPLPEKVSDTLTFSWSNKYLRMGWGERAWSKVILWWIVLLVLTAALISYFSPLVFR